MTDASHIREHMEVIGAAGGHHHLIPLHMVADVEGDKVRMSFNSDLIGQFETVADKEPLPM